MVTCTDRVTAAIGFISEEGVAPDTQRPGGVLRAPTRPVADDAYQAEAEAMSSHPCTLQDLAAPGAPLPTLEGMGFDRIDTSALTRLQAVLAQVRTANTLTPDNIKAIRRGLTGRAFPLSNGKRLRILFVAGEGIILRKAGPNGLKVHADEMVTASNGHEAAMVVHADQDVRGTPVRQMLRGLGPWLFRHEAPDGFNRRSPLFLLNLWIPLQQVTRPLAIMDQRSLDRQRHQLRYALPTEWFLERPADRQLNDIWSFLHDPAQQWYFNSSLDQRSAYVFNTLGAPHVSFILPGEAKAEECYLALQAACRAMQQNDHAALQSIAVPVLDDLPADCTAPLRAAIDAMMALLREVLLHEVKTQPAPDWQTRARAAMDRVVRKSIEMRMVCWVS